MTPYRAGAAGAALLTLLLLLPAPRPAGAAPPPDWMQVDAEGRLVRLHIIAAVDGTNGTFNFNGHANGTLTITVPLGWRVEVKFTSHGGAYPHSLAIAEIETPMPHEGGKVAFPRAYTRDLVKGILDDTDEFRFVANREGKFWLFCGVTGHGYSGMWNYLVVSREAALPSVAVPAR